MYRIYSFSTFLKPILVFCRCTCSIQFFFIIVLLFIQLSLYIEKVERPIGRRILQRFVAFLRSAKRACFQLSRKSASMANLLYISSPYSGLFSATIFSTSDGMFPAPGAVLIFILLAAGLSSSAVNSRKAVLFSSVHLSYGWEGKKCRTVPSTVAINICGLGWYSIIFLMTILYHSIYHYQQSYTMIFSSLF